MGWLKGIPRKPHDDEGRALLSAYERATEAGATFENVDALRASDYYRLAPEDPAALEEASRQEHAALDKPPGWEADIEELERASMAPRESLPVEQCEGGPGNVAILQPREALDTEPEVPVDLEDPRYLRHIFPARHPWQEHDGFEVGAAVGERVQAWLDEGAPRRELDRFAVVGPDLVCVSWPDPSKRRFRL